MRSVFKHTVSKLGPVLVLGTLAVMSMGVASASANYPFFNPFESTPKTLTGGAVTIESSIGGLNPIKCSSVNGTYTPENQSEGPAKITLKGCASGFFGACTTSGLATGEINAISRARLAYLSRANHEAAMVLNYHKSEELPTFATFICGGTSFSLHGSVVAKITPVNTFSGGKYELILKSTANTQEFTKYQVEKETLEEFTAKLRIGFGEEVGGTAALNAVALKFQGSGFGELVA